MSTKKLKFMIGVDLEGMAGVCGDPGQKLTHSGDYAFACRQGVREVNAAVKALFDTGAEQVIVWDNHGTGKNLDLEQLDPRCDILIGNHNKTRWNGLDETFSGVLLIGYHPMDNTEYGVLAHTYSSVKYQYVKVNGQEVGEMAIDAAVAGTHGVPVIFVSSDQAGAKEAREFFPRVKTVATKKGLSRNGIISKHPLRVPDEIYAEVKGAVRDLDQMKPFHFKLPLILEKRYKNYHNDQTSIESLGGKTLDLYTFQIKLDNVDDIIRIRL